ncbi:3-deoxy-D-arabino-heptulosonate 7-phosphate synthase [Parathielavia appendiculata]|uniref:Phospho-2-dehydro-3-deoxyheptonate aldolase n=1 Tax=Parathielavia appendiculata TaxID=2587402 RepID=A0AAN6TUR9_9PEZI|nr:3-deoxy-D-arabino-heptulosonate 7-phosphate synthase [Parathielavia appendiculata]
MRTQSQPSTASARISIMATAEAKSRYNVSITTKEIIFREEVGSSPWTADSWKSKVAAQAVQYADIDGLRQTCSLLRELPPLVGDWEVDQLRERLYHAALGSGFIIQGGDCAESFADVKWDTVKRKVDLLYTQSRILEESLQVPTTAIGRIAGQFAKPRSNLLETLPTGEVVHAFRGHNVNSEDPSEREPDHRRLLLGYMYSAAAQSMLRRMPLPLTSHASDGKQVEFSLFTSHEALNLPYEASLTHNRYNLSASTIWLGERTRQLDGAHVEYARGLRNPVGVKIGPNATPEDVVALLNVLADRAAVGKVTLITRIGRGRAPTVLPPIIDAVRRSGHIPLWMSDPCHGNTFSTPSGIKTRRVQDMLAELQETYTVHQACGSFLGGVHIEQTGDNVTECLDETVMGDNDEYFGRRYQSLCDPRLSRDQAIWLIEQFSSFVRAARR